MPRRPPASFQTIESDGGVCFRLPPQRSLPWGGRTLRMMLLPLAALLAIGAGLLLWPMLTGPYPKETTDSTTRMWVLASVGLGIMVLMAGGVLGYHLLLDYFGRLELRVDAEKLRRRYRLGPLRGGAKEWPVFRVRELAVVGPPPPAGRDQPDWEDRDDPLLDLPTILSAEIEITGTKLLAMHYPVRMLGPLANALAERMNRDRQDPPRPGQPEPLRVRYAAAREEPSEAAPSDPVAAPPRSAASPAAEPVEAADAVPAAPTPPPDSRIRVEHTDGRLTLTLPPYGYGSGKALSNLGYALFMFLIPGAVISLFTMAEAEEESGWSVWTSLSGIVVIMMMLFCLIAGLALVWEYFSKARSTTIVDAGEDFLLISGSGVFRTHQDQWERKQLKAIDVESFRIDSQNPPILHLQIETEDGSRQFFNDRDERELRWIADLLRRKLRLPAT